MFDWTTAADGMFPLKSLNIIATNANCDINLCNRCEGNCATDSDCAGNLKCWKRSYSHSTVPGCATGGEAKNYCYEPCPEGALPVNGCKNTFFSFDFTPTKALSIKTCKGNCDECEGDCASDDQCAGNLKCWKREHSHSNVPGCATGGGTKNYCYKPCPNEGSTAVPYVHGCRSNLRTVLRETAGCSVTDGTIDVWVNGATAANEVYDIISSSDMRLGGQLIMGTNNIVDVGSLQAASVNAGTLYVTDLSGTGVVDEDNIKNGAVTTSAIRSNAVTTATIKNGAVIEAKIGTNAVSSAKIKNGAVTEAKIGSNAVTGSKIKNGAVHAAHIWQGHQRFTFWKVTVRGSPTEWSNDALKVEGGSLFGGVVHVRAPQSYIVGSGKASVLASYQAKTFSGQFVQGNAKHKFSIYAEGIIYSATYVAASDERIKENIQPIVDFEALNILRKLDAKSYEYKDKYERGQNRTFGFIAQDVQKHIPEAVKQISKEIPSIYDWVEVSFFKQGEKYNMKLLNRVLEPGKYAFYVSKTEDNNTTSVKSVDMTTEDGISFISNDKHDGVFLRGPYVDDFLTIDKNKIFSVAYAALQQVDKNQIVLQQKVASLEETIAKLSERLAALDGQS